MIKVKCLECGKLRRNRYKGLCHRCYHKTLTRINMPRRLDIEKINKELNKTKIINEYGQVSFPSWMAGYSFKLINLKN